MKIDILQRFKRGSCALPYAGLLAGCLALSGCGVRTAPSEGPQEAMSEAASEPAEEKEAAGKSRGVDNGIEGFLFNFDQREEVNRLVQAKKGGKLPVKVQWYFAQEETVENESEAEALRIEGTVTSEDPSTIRTIYYALSNSIIVGNALNQHSLPAYFILFTLDDGQECRFDFVSTNTIHLSTQNYVIETDGNLWKALGVQ